MAELSLPEKVIAALTRQVVVFQNGLPVMRFDASISETHSRDTQPTEFEVENGQTISDHIVMKPFNLKMQAVISDTPISSLIGVAAALTTTRASQAQPNPAVLKNSSIALAALPLIPATQLFEPSKSTYEQLLALQADRFPVDLNTSLRGYTNLFIKKISVPREAKTGGGIVVDLEFVQLLLISPLTVATGINTSIPDLAAGVSAEGAKSANPFAGDFAKGVGIVKSATGN